jgi:hypothetical protein
MTIYSGYFAGMRRLHYPNPISIALKPPPNWDGLSAVWLAPQKEWFWNWKAHCETLNDAKEEYQRLYFQTTLRNTSPQEIVDRLSKLSNGEDCTLLCFEKPPAESIIDVDKLTINGSFCHRHLITQFLRNSGYESFELI